MSNSTDIGNPWLEWQQAMLDETFADVRRLSSLPLLLAAGAAGPEGRHAVRSGLRGRPAQAAALRQRRAAAYRTPLVFVYALVNRPYILDLKQGRSVVGNFVERGFDTYLVDWGVPTHADRHLTLDDYINGYLLNVMDFLRERTGAEQVNVLGYCMGGTMSAMFTALHPERVKNLILLARRHRLLPRATGCSTSGRDPEYFDVDRFVDAFGNCPAEFLQSLFLLLRPVRQPDREADQLLRAAWTTRSSSTISSPWRPGSTTTSPCPGEVFRRVREVPLPAEPADAEPDAGRQAHRQPARTSPARC